MRKRHDPDPDGGQDPVDGGRGTVDVLEPATAAPEPA